MLQQNQTLAVRVGIFFTIAIVLVLGLSLQASDGGFFRPTYELKAYFKQTAGIEAGTRVALRGVPIGRVKQLDWDAARYEVEVLLSVEERYMIPEGSIARIQTSSLLGGYFVNISVPEEMPAEVAFMEPGDTIDTRETPTIDEVVSSVTELSTGAEGLIANLDRDREELLAQVREVIEENRSNIREATDSFSRMGPRLEQLTERFNEMTEHMQSGEGTLGALYADRGLYDDLRAFSDTARGVADQISSGEGTIGRLIYDDETLNEMMQIMEDIQRASQEVELAVSENRENFQNLVSSLSETGPRIDRAVAEFNEITRKVNEGEGTIGRLVNDPSLYEDAQRAINQAAEAFEGTEEQGVFRSFFGLVFGALI